MATRETITHDALYEERHRKLFNAEEDKPALEIYIPQELRKTPDLVRSIMMPIWQAETSGIWSRLVDEMADQGVNGDLLEFGVFTGGSLRRLIDLFANKNVINKFWGFDSFSGLPAPDAEADQAGWRKGRFANVSRDEAWTNITRGLAESGHIELVQGWFSETLPKCADLIKAVAYVRIDCDLYQSTVDALKFLDGRLVDGAILYFDDWTFDAKTGETRAFFEFAEKTSEIYRFEKLFVVSQSAFSVRVRHRKR